MKAFTDIEQSKKLTEILPIESADNHYVRKVTDFKGNPVDSEWSHPMFGNPNSKYANYIVQNFTSYEKLPCWSLAALLNYLREIDYFPDILADEHSVKMNVIYYDDEEGTVLHPLHEISVEEYDIIDAAVEMILKLNEQNLV